MTATQQPPHDPDDGPYQAVRHGTRWTVENCLDPHRPFTIHNHHGDALNHAAQLNAAYTRAHTPRPPQPQQAALFDQQETA